MKENINVCTSGGAVGSDLLWGDLALKMGHALYHISFLTHKIDLSSSNAAYKHIFRLSDKTLLVADPYLNLANKTLNRKYPTSSEMVNNLLRRNWFQVRKADRIYAIGPLRGMVVDGGTGWAVQMFLDKSVDKKECYVLNTLNLKWYEFKDKSMQLIKKPPAPYGRWAGVGTRKINETIRKMIFSLY